MRDDIEAYTIPLTDMPPTNGNSVIAKIEGDTEWKHIGYIDKNAAIEYADGGMVASDDGDILLSTAANPMPREISMTMHVTDFDRAVWNETERRFLQQMEFFRDGIHQLADNITEQLPAMEAAMKQVAKSVAPAKTPPFWAHNPTKQKRPRR